MSDAKSMEDVSKESQSLLQGGAEPSHAAIGSVSRRKEKSPAARRPPNKGSGNRSASVDDANLQSSTPQKATSKSRFGFGKLTTSEVESMPLNDVEEGGGKEAPPAPDGGGGSGTPDAMSPIKLGDAKDPSKLLGKGMMKGIGGISHVNSEFDVEKDKRKAFHKLDKSKRRRSFLTHLDPDFEMVDDRTLEETAAEESVKMTKFERLLHELDDGTRRYNKGCGKGPCTSITSIVIVSIGLCSMLYYCFVVMAKTTGPGSASWPVLMHVASVATTVGVKYYYDMSAKDIGYIESMCIIIRSRFWLFPGILDKTDDESRKRVVDKSVLEADQKREQVPFDVDNPGDVARIFPLDDFLTRSQTSIPENRIMQRSLARHHWAYCFDLQDSLNEAEMRLKLQAKDKGVVHVRDKKEWIKLQNQADKVVQLATGQVHSVFPLLEFLDMCIELPKICAIGHACSLFRKVVVSTCCGGRANVRNHDEFPEDGLLATKTEEFERDDTRPVPGSGGVDDRIQGQTEPMPWGTVQMINPADRFEDMKVFVNGMGLFVFLSTLTSFYVMIGGELNFYLHLDGTNSTAYAAGYSYTHSAEHHGEFDDDSDDESGTHQHQHPHGGLYDDDHGDYDHEWEYAYGSLHENRRTSILLIALLIPYSIQVAALMAENLMMMLLTMKGLQLHIENFLEELKRYLTTLSMNKGSFGEAEVQDEDGDGIDDHTVSRDQQIINDKLRVCRDLGLSIALKDFKAEIAKDARAVNDGMFISFLLLAAHFVPLNYYVMNPVLCVPIWILVMVVALATSFFTAIHVAISCNEMIQSTTKDFLHSWQLRLTMIGWSGGYTNDTGTLEWAYVPMDPEQDKLLKKQKAAMEDGEVTPMELLQLKMDQQMIIQQQQSRLASIVKVLAHYEAEDTVVFKILGITITQELLTLAIGLGASSGLAIVADILAHVEKATPVFMCHGMAG